MSKEKKPTPPNSGPGAGTPCADPTQPCPLSDLIIHVTHKDTGEPIRDANVAVSGPESSSGITDANGVAAFHKVQPGKYRVQARKDKHTPDPATTDVDVPPSSSADKTLQLKPFRHFIVVYGDQGKGEHNLGRLPDLAARTHEKEVATNAFAGVPHFDFATDMLSVAHVSTVTDLVAQLSVKDVVYLAYFGHSWNDDAGGTGALYIGQDDAPDTNLSDAADTNNTPVNSISASSFAPGAQIRLFGCRCGYGNGSIGQQLANQLSIPVFGYSNSGGAIFTNDRKLGHGERSATAADSAAKVSAGKDIWLVPANGTPTFREF